MFCSFKFVISTVFLVQIAFSCDSSVSEGPCDGSTITCSTQVCDTTAGMCCPATSTSTTTTATTTTTSSCSDLLNPSTGVSDCPRLAYLCSDSTYYTVMTQQCPKTCGRCSSSSSSSTSCVDKVNPSTGVSDCPSRAYLCSNSVYYDVMTAQCPKTCSRCNSTSSSSSSSSSCADLLNPSTGVSDCPSRAYLCYNSVYYNVMTVQCPKTCGRCSSSSSTVTSSTSTVSATTCADLTNAATGTSDCASRVAYCTNSVYLALMKVQCPKTCGFCS